MKYCSKCGKELIDEAVICPGCGCAQANTMQQNQLDESNFGYALLGFFFPVVGFVLYLVWKADTPLKAKSAGKGALIGFLSPLILFTIFAFIAFFGGMISAITSY